MKKILITGANSYVGTNVEKWLMKEPEKYNVETLNMKDPNWKEFDFSKFDVVFHVAGIVHAKEKRNNKEIFFKINSMMTSELFDIVKKHNIQQFIFMSTMSVFGLNSGIIDEKTIVNPKTSYAKSKLEAEKSLISKKKDLKITIIRPPMIYGTDAPGNLSKLLKTLCKFPFFPKPHNQRSMIDIDNFCKFIEICIDFPSSGTFYPQDYDYVRTVDLLRYFMSQYNKKIYFLPIFGYIVILFRRYSATLKKIFSDLKYDKKMLGGPESSYIKGKNLSYNIKQIKKY